jgi:hypothetical protein
VKSWLVALGLLVSSSALAEPPLQLFGGLNHKTYLGCLNCNEFSSDSVHNQFGRYGSEFSSESIMNQFSEYGSRFSTYSACNSFASDPPVIVDKGGNYYGRLSVNDRLAIRDPEVRGWIKGVCASH